MKTKNFFSCLVKIFTHRAMCFLTLGLLFSLGVDTVKGQKISLGVTLSSMVSGSGLGHMLSPQLTLNTERHTFSAGINVQSRNNNFTGLRGRYLFIMNPEEKIELFLFYDIASHNKAFLGKLTSTVESGLNPEFAGYFNTVRIKTIEQHIGFGMNIYVIGSMKIFGAVGVGYYNTLNCAQQNLFQYRFKDDFSLMLMTGIKIDLKRI